MPRVVNFPDPVAATTVGASMQFVRVAATAAGVQVSYLPGNGDDPLQWDLSQFTAAEKQAVADAHAACVRVYKALKGYV